MLHIYAPIDAKRAPCRFTHSTMRRYTRSDGRKNFFSHVLSIKIICKQEIVAPSTFLYCCTIVDSVKGIEEAETRILGSAKKQITFLEEDKSKITAAIFYSIASTQKGLQVVETYKKYI